MFFTNLQTAFSKHKISYLSCNYNLEPARIIGILEKYFA